MGRHGQSGELLGRHDGQMGELLGRHGGQMGELLGRHDGQSGELSWRHDGQYLHHVSYHSINKVVCLTFTSFLAVEELPLQVKNYDIQ